MFESFVGPEGGVWRGPVRGWWKSTGIGFPAAPSFSAVRDRGLHLIDLALLGLPTESLGGEKLDARFERLAPGMVSADKSIPFPAGWPAVGTGAATTVIVRRGYLSSSCLRTFSASAIRSRICMTGGVSRELSGEVGFLWRKAGRGARNIFIFPGNVRGTGFRLGIGAFGAGREQLDEFPQGGFMLGQIGLGVRISLRRFEIRSVLGALGIPSSDTPAVALAARRSFSF